MSTNPVRNANSVWYARKSARYEQRFAEAGLAVLSFDFRRVGASPGEPRQRIRARDLLVGAASALSCARWQPFVDPSRVALWGTSLGASHAR